MTDNRRLKLHDELKEVLGSDNVYYQPPESLKMKYPCIVYEDRPSQITRANNAPYLISKSWDVTYIRARGNRDNMNEIVNKIIEKFQYCQHNAHFISDNLIHDVFLIHY